MTLLKIKHTGEMLFQVVERNQDQIMPVQGPDRFHVTEEETRISVHGEREIVTINIEMVLEREVTEVLTRGKDNLKAQDQSQITLETGQVIVHLKEVNIIGEAVLPKREGRCIILAQEEDPTTFQGENPAEGRVVTSHHLMR